MTYWIAMLALWAGLGAHGLMTHNYTLIGATFFWTMYCSWHLIEEKNRRDK